MQKYYAILLKFAKIWNKSEIIISKIYNTFEICKNNAKQKQYLESRNVTCHNFVSGGGRRMQDIKKIMYVHIKFLI